MALYSREYCRHHRHFEHFTPCIHLYFQWALSQCASASAAHCAPCQPNRKKGNENKNKKRKRKCRIEALNHDKRDLTFEQFIFVHVKQQRIEGEKKRIRICAIYDAARAHDAAHTVQRVFRRLLRKIVR